MIRQATKKIEIAAVGDVFFNQPLNFIHEPEKFNRINLLIREGDVAIANLEMAFTNRGARADKLSALRGDPSLTSELAMCGFSAVTLANNHAMDYGIIGLEDTLASINDANLQCVGAGRDISEAQEPLSLKFPGDRLLHILNFACTLPPGSAAGKDRPGVAPLRVTQQYLVNPVFIQEQPGTAPWVETFTRPEDEHSVLELVSRSREKGGRVVVVLHWGLPPQWQAPYQGYLATYQRPLASRLVSAGAHAIIGHHPRVLHGVEVIDGCPVFYSLGIFIFHPWITGVPFSPREDEPGYIQHLRKPLSFASADLRKRESVFLHLSWQGEDWDARFTPIMLNHEGEPEIAEGEHAERILNNLKSMSAQLDSDVLISGDIGRVQWGS